MASVSHQDWDTVILRKNQHKKPFGQRELAEAKAKGDIETVKKRDAGGNVQHAHTVVPKKLDETDPADFKHQTVTYEFKVELQRARQAKRWTQKELAQKINQKASVITEYESGAAIPNPQVISLLNRALGVQLPKIPKKKVVKNDE